MAFILPKTIPELVAFMEQQPGCTIARRTADDVLTIPSDVSMPDDVREFFSLVKQGELFRGLEQFNGWDLVSPFDHSINETFGQTGDPLDRVVFYDHCYVFAHGNGEEDVAISLNPERFGWVFELEFGSQPATGCPAIARSFTEWLHLTLKHGPGDDHYWNADPSLILGPIIPGDVTYHGPRGDVVENSPLSDAITPLEIESTPPLARHATGPPSPESNHLMTEFSREFNRIYLKALPAGFVEAEHGMSWDCPMLVKIFEWGQVDTCLCAVDHRPDAGFYLALPSLHLRVDGIREFVGPVLGRPITWNKGATLFLGGFYRLSGKGSHLAVGTKEEAETLLQFLFDPLLKKRYGRFLSSIQQPVDVYHAMRTYAAGNDPAFEVTLARFCGMPDFETLVAMYERQPTLPRCTKKEFRQVVKALKNAEPIWS